MKTQAIPLLFFASTFVSGDKANKCRLYLAQSSSNSNRLSVYSGVDVPSDSVIGNADIGIPVIDWFSHNKQLGGEQHNRFWSKAEIAADFEDKIGNEVIVPGIGFSAPRIPGITNARLERSSVLNRFRFDDPSGSSGHLDWRKDPGAGAVSEYSNVTMVSTTDIFAGMEIFPRSFHLESNETAFIDDRLDGFRVDQHRSKSAFYEKADAILKQFSNLVDERGEWPTSPAMSELWALLREDVVFDEDIRRLLPPDPDEAVRVAETGTAVEQNPDVLKTMKWLKENGQCVDNLVAGASTIGGAGKGAFASRLITKGSIIAPGPLLRFTEDQLNLYERKDPEQGKPGVVGQQLLVNYCFSHPGSSVYLYPYSSMTGLINHKSDDPNAEIRWSASQFHDDRWLEVDRHSLEKENPYAHLMFDFVALRDIHEGEEVFIDYGPAWEEAWSNHVRAWSTRVNDSHDPSSSSLNLIDERFKTIDELAHEPYPEAIEVVCAYKFDEYQTSDLLSDEEKSQLSITSEPVMEAQVRRWKESPVAGHYRCDVLAHEVVDGRNIYGARIHVKEAQYMIVTEIPQSAMLLVDKPYTSPMHRQGVFRHPIGIPSSLFPDVWLD